MKRKIFIYILLGQLLSWSMNAQQRIVGGSKINITEAPWQVVIQTKGNFTGGGSILAPNLVLTASHVVNKYTASDVKVGVGVSRSLTYTSNVKAIDILSANKTSYYNIGNSVRVTGWGITILPEDFLVKLKCQMI